MSSSNLVFLAAAALLIFWAVGAYNRLVRLKNAMVKSFAQIEVQLKRRHDLVPALVEAARTYLQHEPAALQAVISAGNQAHSASGAARNRPGKTEAIMACAAAEQMLDSSLSRLFALAENCSDLTADPTLHELNQELASLENPLGFARQSYNDAVLDYNHAQSQFPALVVARLFGFAPSPTLQAGQGLAGRQMNR